MKITTTQPRVEVHVNLGHDGPPITGPYGPHQAEARAVAFSAGFNGTRPVSVSVKAIDPDGEERWRGTTWDALPPLVAEQVEREVRARLHRPDAREAA